LRAVFVFGVVNLGNSCEERKIYGNLRCQYCQEYKVEILIELNMLFEDFNEYVPIDADVFTVVADIKYVQIVPYIFFPIHYRKQTSHYYTPG
jgi:hypothetical protein